MARKKLTKELAVRELWTSHDAALAAIKAIQGQTTSEEIEKNLWNSLEKVQTSLKYIWKVEEGERLLLTVYGDEEMIADVLGFSVSDGDVKARVEVIASKNLQFHYRDVTGVMDLDLASFCTVAEFKPETIPLYVSWEFKGPKYAALLKDGPKPERKEN